MKLKLYMIISGILVSYTQNVLSKTNTQYATINSVAEVQLIHCMGIHRKGIHWRVNDYPNKHNLS
ncbi:hypothetical protein M758_UG039000 [Ceratodon purpureus]|nr:hypothetical protein M758_UG039000 [Ceratodon purpureus]